MRKWVDSPNKISAKFLRYLINWGFPNKKGREQSKIKKKITRGECLIGTGKNL